MEVQRKKISELEFDKRNARRHDDRNMEAIKRSLEKFGQQKPIVIDKNGKVIAGNGTLWAAKMLAWAEINVVVTELSGDNLTAYGIADNRTNELSMWDESELLALIKEVGDNNLVGFTNEEIADMNKGLLGDFVEIDSQEGSDSFAEGDQFGDGVIVEIKTTQTDLDNGIKEELLGVCSTHGLNLIVRAGGK